MSFGSGLLRIAFWLNGLSSMSLSLSYLTFLYESFLLNGVNFKEQRR